VDASQLISATLARLIWLTYPPGKEAEPRGVKVTRKFYCPVARLWKILGESFLPPGERFEVLAPAFVQVDAAFRLRYPEAQTVTEDFTEIIAGFRTGILGLKVSLANYERLDHVLQDRVMRLARQRYAFEQLRVVVEEWRLAEIRNRQVGQLTDSPEPLLTGRGNEALNQQIEIAKWKKAAGIALAFIGRIQWEEAALAIEGDVLPTGPWPRAAAAEPDPVQLQEERALVEPLEFGDELALQENDDRVEAERDRLYTQELGCRRLEVRGFLGNQRYIAYVYRTPSGRLATIFECPEFGNATFVFLITPGPNTSPTDWQKDLARTRYELRTAPADQRGTFLKAFYHTKNWWDNLSKFIRALP
jgi:hypothetical protein